MKSTQPHMTLPVPRPLVESIFEDLQYRRTNIMFGIEPRQGFVRVERCPPLEPAVRLKLHAEQRVSQAGEVVVVDACVDERCRQTDLLVVSGIHDGEY